MNADLGTTNLWLGVIALASVGGCAAAATAVVIALRVRREALEAIASMENRHIEPLVADLRGLMRDVHSVTYRLQRLDEEARAAARIAGRVAATLIGSVQEPMTSALSIVRGFTAAFSVVADRLRNGGGRAEAGEYGTHEGGSHVRH